MASILVIEDEPSIPGRAIVFLPASAGKESLDHGQEPGANEYV